jgi:hypothetical protein
MSPFSKTPGGVLGKRGSGATKDRFLKANIVGHDCTGRLRLYIENSSGKYQYTFYVDTALIPEWERLIDQHPGQVIQEIRRNHERRKADRE